jgi:toxin ParE1/3/4
VRLVWAPTAIRHLREAAAFIAQDNPDAADSLVTRLTVAAETLALFPASGRATADGRRMLSVPGTPFRLVYRPQADLILIVAVWHGARAWPFDPR